VRWRFEIDEELSAQRGSQWDAKVKLADLLRQPQQGLDAEEHQQAYQKPVGHYLE
jgi:hypothetical protein